MSSNLQLEELPNMEWGERPASDEWVCLKVNMILFGSFVRRGILVNLRDIPKQLRRADYIERQSPKLKVISSGYAATLESVRKLSEGKCHFVRDKRETIHVAPKLQNKFSHVREVQKFYEKSSRWKIYKLIETFRGKKEWLPLKVVFLLCEWDIPDLPS